MYLLPTVFQWESDPEALQNGIRVEVVFAFLLMLKKSPLWLWSLLNLRGQLSFHKFLSIPKLQIVSRGTRQLARLDLRVSQGCCCPTNMFYWPIPPLPPKQLLSPTGPERRSCHGVLVTAYVISEKGVKLCLVLFETIGKGRNSLL